MADLPNIKEYVNAIINPKIKALSLVYEEHVKYMQRMVDLQTKLFYDTQTQIAELTKKVFDLQEQVLKYQLEVINQRKNQFESSQVREMLRRIQELNYITSILYQKYVVLAGEQDWNPEDLPSFTNPWLPGDYVKTEEEVEQEWRILKGLSEKQELTDLEKKELQEYKDKYYATHWQMSETTSTISAK